MNDTREKEWQAIKSKLESAMLKVARLEHEATSANRELLQSFKMLREHLSLSQEQLAKIMGVSPMYVSLLERGKRQWTARNVTRLINPLFDIAIES
jgi:DNA-binding XRE family transcriptional regulator